MPPADLPPDPIKHVVMLVLENHSFDQMLGCVKELYPTLEGVDPRAPGENSYGGAVYRQEETRERQMTLDPHHEVEHVLVQLAGGNSGFVKDYATCYPESSDEARRFVMGYYPMGFLPALHTLAKHYTICDHWFSSLPGPTWPNRFFALTGTACGRVAMPGDGTHTVDLKGWFEQDQATIFDRLTENGIHWKVYFHDVPQSCTLMHQRLPQNSARYFYIDEFYDDARGAEAEFPQFCFIEPDFMGINENDDHPPHDIMKAEKLTADVYNALRANRDLWLSTLLVVFFDEHGGFYDHVVPPAAEPPDSHQEEYAFDRLGVRVPALLISPWADRRFEPTQFDHTSLLKYLTDKWRLGPLGRRTAQATSIAVALKRRTPRADADMIERIELTLDELTPPDAEREEQATSLKSAHHAALERMRDYLKISVVEDLPRWWSAAARLIEAAKGSLERALGWLYREPKGIQATIAEPDKLAHTSVGIRNDVARFLMHQKRRAVGVLAARIGDESLPRVVREHAVHTLALISGRPVHRRPDKIASANALLRYLAR